jgi:hypothetical protein
MNKEKIWSCTIITYNEELNDLPNGADFPPRRAAVEAIEGLGLSIHSVYSKWGCEEFTPKITALKRRIAELETYNLGLANESCAQQKRIAELEEECDIRDLEQQAKGIEWVLACRELNLSEGEVHTLMDKCNQLRQHAKG